MKSLLGMHWIRTHPDGRDFDHVNRMQYPSVKTFEWMHKDRNFCNDLLAALPRDSYILARNHPRSEQKEDVWRDPKGTGTRHADEWARDLREGQCFLPTDRTFFLPVNEPDATNGDRNALDIYTATYLDRLTEHGLRGGAFNFSTGHPRTVDGTGGTKADYSVFERSHRAIVRGHHIGVLHIYGTAAVPCAPGHYDRIWACDWQDVEWVVGECGADEHVIGGGAHDGYLISMNGHIADYCAWLDTLIMGVNDPRIHSWQVFTYDFSHPWDSFNVREIRDALESYQWRHMTQPPTPSTPPGGQVFLPGVGTGVPAPVQPGQPVAVVQVEDGANIRSGPGTEHAIRGAEPYRAMLPIIGRNEDASWWLVDLPHIQGWVSSAIVSSYYTDDVPVVVASQPPTPAPSEPVASGIIDPRVLEAILQVESGGQTHGADGRPIIRFESHIFRNRAANKERVDKFFRHNQAQPWTGQEWRPSIDAPWKSIHTGRQTNEYDAFAAAQMIDVGAAHESISMGAPQIMGFNHRRIGYPDAVAMFESFERSANPQIIGMINYILSDPALVKAISARDWEGIARGYNGGGNVAEAAAKYKAAYERLGQ